MSYVVAIVANTHMCKLRIDPPPITGTLVLINMCMNKYKAPEVG